MFEIFIAVLDSIIYFKFLEKFLDLNKRSRFIQIIGCIVMPGITLICDYFSIMSSMKVILFMIVGTGMIRYVDDVKTKKIIVGNFIWLVVTTISETIVMGTMMSIYDLKSTAIFLERNEIRFQAVFMAKGLYCFVMMLIASKFTSSRHRLGNKEVIVLGIQAVTCISTVLMMMEISAIGENLYEIPMYLFSIFSMVNLITYLVSFHFTEKYFINKEMEKEYLRMESYTERQLQYYEVKKESENQVRKMYHDLKHHLKAIENMYLTENNGVREYIQEMHKLIEPNENYYDSGNTVIDMILLEKKQIGSENNISIDIKVEPYCLKYYKTINLCTIFANAFDNALEATKLCSVENRTILVRIMNSSDGVSILFQNTFYGERNKEHGRYLTTKEDKKLHGFGLKSIKDAVDNCNGRMSVKTKEDKFILYILLNSSLK